MEPFNAEPTLLSAVLLASNKDLRGFWLMEEYLGANASEADVTAHKLLVLLDAHLSGFQPLSDPEVFDIKSRLINCSQEMKPNMVMTLEEELPRNAGPVVSVWAAVGKLPDGESVFWHRPLPCPDTLAEFLYFHR